MAKQNRTDEMVQNAPTWATLNAPLFDAANGYLAAWQRNLTTIHEEVLRLYGSYAERTKKAIDSTRNSSSISDAMSAQQGWMYGLTEDYLATSAKIGSAFQNLAQDGIALFPLAKASNQSVEAPAVAQAAE